MATRKPRRKAIPAAMRQSVLREYHHACALCSKPNPQLHHIDGDPSHSAVGNLIPLCPNCHLTDQHDASNAIPVKKLLFFRKHKHKLILKPQFNSVWRRFVFLEDIADDVAAAELERQANELVRLVQELVMGGFIGEEIHRRLARPVGPSVFIMGDPSSERSRAAEMAKADSEYRQQLRSARPDIERLIVEQLDHQLWP